MVPLGTTPGSRGVSSRAAAVASSATSPQFGTVGEIRSAYYLAWPTGEIWALHALKKDVLAAFPGHASQLKEYAQAHHLGYDSARELSELVNYANSLTNK